MREQPYDFERLERAVRGLIERHTALLRRHRALREQLADRERRIRSLEAEVLALNQRRQDVAKRIDDLIAQIERVESASGASSAEES